MPRIDRLYSPAEACAISGLKLKAVHNAIDRHILAPAGGTRTLIGGTAKRTAGRFLTGEDLVRLRVWRGVGETLSTERRHRLFKAMAAEPLAKTVKADDLLIVDVGMARRQVDLGVKCLEAAEAVIVTDRATLGGEPVFRGTRIPVYGVVAMLHAGATADELLLGYPMLNARLIELAEIWATAHPRRGRPKSMAGLGLTLKSTRRVPLKPDPLAGMVPSGEPAGG